MIAPVRAAPASWVRDAAGCCDEGVAIPAALSGATDSPRIRSSPLLPVRPLPPPMQVGPTAAAGSCAAVLCPPPLPLPPCDAASP